jgi:hypothetical protein
MVAGWEALLAGNGDDAEARYQAARTIASSRGFRFLPAERVAALPIDELVERIDAAMTPEGKIDRTVAAGVLGLAKRPEITLSKALELYWALLHKSDEGIHLVNPA